MDRDFAACVQLCSLDDLNELDELDALKRYRQTRDPRLRDALVERHLGLAEAAARRYGGRGEDHDDLRQVAVIGLMKAIERFDPDRGTALSTFAVPTMLGELKHHFRDNGWTIRVPRRLQELRRHCNRAFQELQHRLHRVPTIEEVAAELCQEIDDVRIAMVELRDCYRPRSIEEFVRDDPVAEDDGPGERACRDVLVQQLLATLDERDRRIFVLRYYGAMTQQDIADRMGISQMHVSRLLRSGLQDLRDVA